MSEEEKKKPEEKKTKEPKTEEKMAEEPKEPPPPAEAEAPAPPQPEPVLKGFPGVEDVEMDCKTQKVVVKGEKADPVAVLERVQKKINRHVGLHPPLGYYPKQTVVKESRPSSSKDKGTKSEDFISGQRYVILRPKTNVGQMNPKGEEKIAEKRACCMLCFAKLAEGDELLKSACGCTNALVHVTCADTGTRKEGNSCNYCGQEIHNEAVTLHREITTTQGVNAEKKEEMGLFYSCSMM